MDRDTLDTVEFEAHPRFHDRDGDLSESFLSDVRAAIVAADAGQLGALTAPLHEFELGSLLERLQPDERRALVRLAGETFDYAALTEVDEAIRLEIVHAMTDDGIAAAVRTLDSDDAVFILEDLGEAQRASILERLPFRERIRLRRPLGYPDETAGRRMQTEYVAVPPYWSVGQTLDYLHDDTSLPERFFELLVVDPSFRLLGTVELHDVLRADRKQPIDSLKRPTRHAIPATTDQEEAARIFQRYNLLSAAVVDDGDRLVGVLTIDDIVDVIQSEADEDIRRLGGVGDEEISDTVVQTVRSRFGWLLVNLVTAILASLVIDLFDGTIQQMVALAVLMPIVASMGGNAGTQTMTVAVRALATRDLNIHNAARIVRRELVVGLLNGLLFAALVGCVAAFWFADVQLGQILAAAMVINMLAAALAGILIPIALDRMGVDPAIASGTFVTTVTDVVGFFAFLGLAALLLFS